MAVHFGPWLSTFVGVFMELSNKITAKLFVGCHITPEMRLHLNKSKEWKQISVIPIEIREVNIQEIHYQGKDYFGFYLSDHTAKIKELQNMKTSIQSILKNCCPEYHVTSPRVYVLPQIFIA